MTRVGVVGLGRIGRAMTRHLLRAGFSVSVYDPDAEAAGVVPIEGAVPVGSARALAERSEICLIPLAPEPPGPGGGHGPTRGPSSDAVERVVLGPEGLLAGAAPGSVIVEMRTGDPAQAHRLALAARARGVTYVDAPFSGAEEKAEEGTLAIMAGASPEDFERCRPVFAAFGRTVVRAGGVGAGHALKLVNNIIVTLNTLALCEALALAVRMGIEPDVALEVINGGAARSWSSETKGPKLLAGGGQSVDQIGYQRDVLELADRLGEALGVRLPLTRLAWRLLDAAAILGLDEQDTAAMLRWQAEVVGSLDRGEMHGSTGSAGE